MAQLRVTTVSGNVTINDLGRRVFTHPTVDLDILPEYGHSNILGSADMAAAVAGGTLLLKNAQGVVIPVVEDVAPLQDTVDVVQPTITDDKDSGHSINSLWSVTATGQVFICKDNAVGAAVWAELSQQPTSVTEVNTSYTVLISDSTIIATAAITITLPPVSTGKVFTIIHNAPVGFVTLDGDAAETINGELTMRLERRYTSITVVGTSSGWLLK